MTHGFGLGVANSRGGPQSSALIYASTGVTLKCLWQALRSKWLIWPGAAAPCCPAVVVQPRGADASVTNSVNHSAGLKSD